MGELAPANKDDAPYFYMRQDAIQVVYEYRLRAAHTIHIIVLYAKSGIFNIECG